MRNVLAYLGLDRTGPAPPLWQVVIAVVPPLLLASLVASVDGVGGAAGWGLNVLYIAAAFAAWLPVLARFASRWRGK